MTVKDLLNKLDMDIDKFYIITDYYHEFKTKEDVILSFGEHKVKNFDVGFEELIDFHIYFYIEVEE